MFLGKAGAIGKDLTVALYYKSFQLLCNQFNFSLM